MEKGHEYEMEIIRTKSHGKKNKFFFMPGSALLY